MIKNIPIKYTDNDLLDELKEFKDKFDVLFLPYDFIKKGNRGYAFINFTHYLHILMFYTIFQNRLWTKYESKKICKLVAANYQGINQIKNHAERYKEKKPLFLDIQRNTLIIEIPSVNLFLILDLSSSI